MNLRRFIATSAEDAVTQIQAEMGRAAVVVDVRPLPGRRWQAKQLEVLATIPEEPPRDERVDQLCEEISRLKFSLQAPTPAVPVVEPTPLPEPIPVNAHQFPKLDESGESWQVRTLLEDGGLLPLYAQCVLDRLQTLYGNLPPETLTQEMMLVRAVMKQFWNTARPLGGRQLHVLIGGTGVGKTTALSKWLSHAVLLEGRSAHVWRLDGRSANTAETLSVHGDVLGVPVERSWSGEPIAEDLAFIDLPGVSPTDGQAVEELADLLRQFPQPQVHLVVSATCEPALLLSQVRGFSALPINDLIVTRLDEDARWNKLWNLVLGTNYPIRFFSAGQNVPGDFIEAAPEVLFRHQFSQE
jgi:flagellar biosynthesis protein FlhF